MANGMAPSESESESGIPSQERLPDDANASAPAEAVLGIDSATDEPSPSDGTPLGLEANRAYQDRFKVRYGRYRRLLPEETRNLKGLRKAGETDFYRAIDAFFGTENAYVISQSHGVGLLKAGWGDVWLDADPVLAADRKWPPRGGPVMKPGARQPVKLADQVDGLMQRMEERKSLFGQGGADGR
jgi:hypothetical protein